MTEEESRIFRLLHDSLQDPSSFSPNNAYAHEVNSVCLELWERDYYCSKLEHSVPLCTSYPNEIILPLQQKSSQSDNEGLNEALIAKDELLNLVCKGKHARTRGRFPAPVILIGSKYVCRSSTLAHPAEIYARQGLDYFTKGETEAARTSKSFTMQPEITEQTSVSFTKENEDPKLSIYLNKSSKHSFKLMKTFEDQQNKEDESSEWMLSRARKYDIDLMHKLKVNAICDLMVENKKAKYGVYVTSSEKVDDRDRYSEFELISIPYPGCEFFADYTKNSYTSTGLKFDWNQAFIDAELKVPANIPNLTNINWSTYTEWELVKITQNYLKLILNCLASSDFSGILLHCISGWDRTPLFVSLVRLSLWADNLIHQSLDAEEIVYLTLAYDWLLFGHLFSDRVSKEEEIMHFCFDFLKFISSEEYSLLPLVHSMAKDPFAIDKSALRPVNRSLSSISPKAPLTNPNESSDFEYISYESNNSSDTDHKFFESRSDSALNGNTSKKVENDRFSPHLKGTSLSLNGTLPANQRDSHSGSKNGFDRESQSSDELENQSVFLFSVPPKNAKILTSSHASEFNGQSSSQLTKPSDFDLGEASGLNACFSDQLLHPTNCDVLGLKLKKRRERLTKAESIMIPFYCAVVQKRKRELSVSSSGLSSMVFESIGSIMKFVTRT